LRIIIEALKIDKMPQARRVHFWFLTLFVASSAIYLTVPEGAQMESFAIEFSAFLTQGGGMPFPPPVLFLSLLKQLGLVVISLWFILLYAVHWLFASSDIATEVMGEDEVSVIPPLPDLGDKTPGMTALKAFPTLIVLAVSMIVPYIISLPAMGIPFYVLSTMLSMSIFVVIFENKTLPSAMESSYKMTSGMKFFIFVSFLFLRSVTSIANDLLHLVFTQSEWAGSLIRAFFYALKTLAFGRLAAMFYRSLSAREVLQKQSFDGY